MKRTVLKDIANLQKDVQNKLYFIWESFLNEVFFIEKSYSKGVSFIVLLLYPHNL